MPEGSEPRQIRKRRRPDAGSFPAWLEPAIPYRVERWGKSGAYALAKQARTGSDSSPGLTVRRVGGLREGSVAIYVGAGAVRPRPNFAPDDFRVVAEGYAYSEREARSQAEASLRSLVQGSPRKGHHWAKQAQAVGVRTPDRARRDRGNRTG